MTMVVDNRYQLFRCSYVLCLVCTGDSQDLRTCQLHPWDKIGHIRKQCWSEPQVARRLIPRIPRWKKTEEMMENQKSIKIQKPGVWFETNFQKPGQPGQPIVGIHLTSIISTARTAWTLAGAIRQNTAGWNPRAYASSAQAGRWNGWNATSLGGNPSIHRPGDRDFRSPHFKNYPKCLDRAKRQRCWASEVHKTHRVRANSHNMCII